MTESERFKRPALLTGNRAGKLPHPPRRLGKWLWPATAAALATGTVWGVNHIEDQVERSAPEIVRNAGLNASGLQFDASYRNVDVTGTLPANTSASQLETVLASYRGNNGESIRRATVRATAPVVKSKPEIKAPPVKVTPAIVQPVIETENVLVSAVSDGDTLTLTGMVPTQQHVTVLNDAALHSFSKPAITNLLTVSDQPAPVENVEQRINDFATVISNLENNVIDAQIDLDNDLLSGNITTTDIDMSRKIKAAVPDSLINVVTEHEEIRIATAPLPADSAAIVPMTEVIPDDSQTVTSEAVNDYRPTDNIASLQGEFTLLADSIRELVVFAPSSDALQPSANAVLDDIATALDSYPDVLIEIAGHTDSQSSATYNQDLSQRRAQAVAEYLADRGVDRSRLRPNGYGESQPVATNDTAAGRAQNRRVEFWAF